MHNEFNKLQVGRANPDTLKDENVFVNKIVGWVIPKEFPGTHSLSVSDYEWVIIWPEKAIQIMDRMIKEIEAAKKCVPGNSFNIFQVIAQLESSKLS